MDDRGAIIDLSHRFRDPSGATTPRGTAHLCLKSLTFTAGYSSSASGPPCAPRRTADVVSLPGAGGTCVGGSHSSHLARHTLFATAYEGGCTHLEIKAQDIDPIAWRALQRRQSRNLSSPSLAATRPLPLLPTAPPCPEPHRRRFPPTPQDVKRSPARYYSPLPCGTPLLSHRHRSRRRSIRLYAAGKGPTGNSRRRRRP